MSILKTDVLNLETDWHIHLLLLTLVWVLVDHQEEILWQQIECAWGWQLESWKLNEAQMTPSWTLPDLEKMVNHAC